MSSHSRILRSLKRRGSQKPTFIFSRTKVRRAYRGQPRNAAESLLNLMPTQSKPFDFAPSKDDGEKHLPKMLCRKSHIVQAIPGATQRNEPQSKSTDIMESRSEMFDYMLAIQATQRNREPKSKSSYSIVSSEDNEEESPKMPFRKLNPTQAAMSRGLLWSFVPLKSEGRQTTSAKENQRNSNKHGCILSKDEDEEKKSMVSFYEFIKKPIGFGAFGTCVYSGINIKDGRKVAVKKINCHTNKQTRQYQREIKHLLVLRDCPNIVKYMDVVVKEEVVYIMLELMEGTLETLVSRPSLDIKLTQACHDISLALQFLHGSKIIHRDIKPRNILFISTPRTMLKLADFGLSKMLESDSSSIGYNGGTRCWMSPEVHKSLDQFSTASDIFASGLVLHYLMTSKHPFAPDVTNTKENRLLVEHEIVHNILHNHNLVADGSESLTPEAAHLINRMLEYDKDQRPSADEVLAHPFFWSNQKKVKFLEATANQPEMSLSPSKTRVTSDVIKDLESSHLGAQFQIKPWSEWSPSMVLIYDEMMKEGKRKYKTSSVVELLRFIRNAYQHVSQSGRTPYFQKFLLVDHGFFDNFKSMFIETYKTVVKHDWNITREEVKYAL